MARVVGILGSGRMDGYTIKVLKEALEGVKSVAGVEAELIPTLEYKFGPCISCYDCIRMEEHRCTLKDDMGHLGEGKLWKKIEGINGFIFAAPVHFWMADAATHLFIERLYPYLWSGELKGIPVANISVASNQGMQIIADTMLCELSFTMVMKYVGGLPVHAAYMDEALPRARYLGKKLGEEALKDEKEGRKAPTDEEIWLYYQDKPWSVFPHYIENLTMGTSDPKRSIIKRSLALGTFKNPEAIEKLEQADVEFDNFAHYKSLGDETNAIKSLVKASTFWTHATWKEFLEKQLIGVAPPKAYRPIEE